ncbi:CAF1-domain-containing protein [Xylariaceae sp. AK1471]|nr:CAF1-domain-containing protein [Xylariaceae sp. AK1471]
MEVNSTTFWTILPELMGALVDSRWVAIDVEMTGISAAGRPIPPNSSPQEAYELVKEAAESFQILQLGFTFCKYTDNTSEYETKTVECLVSPLFPPGTGSKGLTQTLNRKFSTSASSYAFLREHDFPFAKALDYGVPYLSKAEELEAKRQGILMLDDDIVDISKLDGPTRRFYSHYRRQIKFASEDVQSRQHICVAVKGQNGQVLDSLEVKLIDQLLREEFPFLVARRIANGAHLNVMWADKVQTSQLQRKNKLSVNRCIGIRYVFDALAGEEFSSKIHPDWIARGTKEQLHGNDVSGFSQIPCMLHAEIFLRCRSPIIVGHHLFHDLAFIYRTFFGPLPGTVDEFLSTIHKLFPRLIDTKYMFARGQEYLGQATQNKTLQDLYNMHSERQFPIVRSTDKIIEENDKSHRAGYDSALTMVLFLKQTVYVKGFWSKSPPVPEKVYRPGQPAQSRQASAASKSHSQRGSILDEYDEGEERNSGLDRYMPLEPDQTVSRRASSVPTARHLHHDSPSRPSENYSENETSIIPLWGSGFWRDFGNKTRIGNICVVQFK